MYIFWPIKTGRLGSFQFFFITVSLFLRFRSLLLYYSSGPLKVFLAQLGQTTQAKEPCIYICTIFFYAQIYISLADLRQILLKQAGFVCLHQYLLRSCMQFTKHLEILKVKFYYVWQLKFVGRCCVL